MAQRGKQWFAERRGGRARVRWGPYFAGLSAVLLELSFLVNLPTLAVGPELGGFNPILFGAVLIAGFVVFNGLVLWQLRRADRAGDPPAATPASSAEPEKPSGSLAAGCCGRCGAPLPPDAPEGLCPTCLLAFNVAAQTEMVGETGPQEAKVVHPPPSTAEVARLFPQLEILECLGRGGMGVVYKARQPRLNRLVALKILARDKEKDAKFAERFAREAQALARLNHPKIVTVYDFGETDGLCYLLMEFVDGVTLRHLLQSGRMAAAEALAIVPRICEALQFAHEHGVVHRDIKPENILIDKQGRLKIADFGIARMIGADDARSGLTAEQVIGTPHYMAPEQIERPTEVDHRADIYSLGVVFYEMLTGELPLGRFQPPSRKVQVDVRLDEIVLRSLEKEPQLRYQQASDVKSDVETVSGSGPLPGSRPSGESRRILRGRGLWVGAAAVVILTLAALIAWSQRTRPLDRPTVSESPDGQVIAVPSNALSPPAPVVSLEPPPVPERVAPPFENEREPAIPQQEHPVSERPPTALELAISEAEADRGEARSRRVADDLRARLQGARSITSWVDRDQALASVAKDAAQEGELEIVRAALNGVTGWTTKDDAAAESAQRLAAAGMHTNALEVARLMTSWSKRDETLRALSAMTLPVAGGTRRREHAARDDVATRYAAAAAITSFGTKDIAMAALARDAARGGNVEIVKKALAAISSFSTKDEAAVGAAQELAKVGLRAEALEITRVISSFSKRDAILRELAEGKPDRHN